MKTRFTKKVRNWGTRTIAKPTHADIARLAHDLYEREGKPDGKHLDHWFNAESMIEGNFGYGSSHREHDFSKTTGDE